ncbi:hypothetical protein Lal_00028149, partial [Lupinus albus]
DDLKVTHEETREVKCATMNTLKQEYELFSVLLDKNINDDQLTNEVLRCLDRTLKPKVTTINETNDL